MKSLTLITATLAATVIGFTFGILFAPNKGAKTRNNISKKSHKYAGHLTDSYDDFVDKISHSFENIEAKTLRIAEKGKAKVKKAATDLNAKMN